MIRRSIFALCRLGVIFRRSLLVLFILVPVYLFFVHRNYEPSVSNSIHSTRNTKHQASISVQLRKVTPETISKHERKNLSISDKSEKNLDDFASEFDSPISLLVNKTLSPNSEASRSCPPIENNTNLMGHVGQALLLIEDLDELDIVNENTDMLPGGRWVPSGCAPIHKVAIIIPYRDRKTHLVRLLDFLIPILKRQLLDFRFIVTEQYGDDLFNKGRIMNAAFAFAQTLNVDCVTFHDVDMFPQDDRVPYDCPGPYTPRHVGAFVNTLGYQLWYKELVGGVLTMRINDFIRVNGYSNMYWAWGGEDDDMGTRILSFNYTIERPDDKFARYSMLKHIKRKRVASKMVYKLLKDSAKRISTDGFNETNKWKVVKTDIKPLYYHLMVDVGKPPEDWKDT